MSWQLCVFADRYTGGYSGPLFTPGITGGGGGGGGGVMRLIEF